jgi:hypothetical protein
MFRHPIAFVSQLLNVPRQFHVCAMALPVGSPARLATRSNTETGKDSQVAWLRGTADSVLASAVTGVVSNPAFHSSYSFTYYPM